MDRLQAGLEDRMEHLAVDTDDEDETAERQQERVEHQQIQLAIISAQRNAVIEMRDRRRDQRRDAARGRARAGSRRATDGGLAGGRIELLAYIAFLRMTVASVG